MSYYFTSDQGDGVSYDIGDEVVYLERIGQTTGVPSAYPSGVTGTSNGSIFTYADPQGKSDYDGAEYLLAFTNYASVSGVTGSLSTLWSSAPAEGVMRIWHTGNAGYTMRVVVNGSQIYASSHAKSFTLSRGFNVAEGASVEVAYAPTVTFYGVILPFNYP